MAVQANTSSSDLDPASPTARIHAELARQGLQPTAQNVRQFLMSQSMGQPTLENLTVQAPPPADPRQSTRVGGAKPVDSGNFDTGGTQTTSAAPTGGGTPAQGGGPSVNVGGTSPSAGEIATAIGLGGLLPAILFANRGRGTTPGESAPVADPRALFRPETVAPAPDGSVPATPGAGQEPLVPDERGIIDYTQLEPPRSPMDRAMERAVPSYTGDMPPVSPDAVGNYRPGPSTPVENAPLPFNRGDRTTLTPPTAEDQAQVDRMRELNIPKAVPGRDAAVSKTSPTLRGPGAPDPAKLRVPSARTPRVRG